MKNTNILHGITEQVLSKAARAKITGIDIVPGRWDFDGTASYTYPIGDSGHCDRALKRSISQAYVEEDYPIGNELHSYTTFPDPTLKGGCPYDS